MYSEKLRLKLWCNLYCHIGQKCTKEVISTQLDTIRHCVKYPKDKPAQAYFCGTNLYLSNKARALGQRIRNIYVIWFFLPNLMKTSFILIGVAFIFLMPIGYGVLEYSHKTYFSENALLPGLVKVEFNMEHVARQYLEDLRHSIYIRTVSS